MRRAYRRTDRQASIPIAISRGASGAGAAGDAAPACYDGPAIRWRHVSLAPRHTNILKSALARSTNFPSDNSMSSELAANTATYRAARVTAAASGALDMCGFGA